MKKNPTTLNNNRLVIFCIFAILTIASVGAVITKDLGQYAERTIRRDGEAAISALSKSLINQLKEADHLVHVLSGSPLLVSTLSSGQAQTYDHINDVLDRYNSRLSASVIYLLDTKGNTLVATNRDDPQSFVGKNYQFRPYFKEAVEEGSGHYFARGITSGRRGYYAASPVKGEGGELLGVAVIKKGIDAVEKDFYTFENAFLIDPNGVIFLSSKPGWVLRSLWPIEGEVLKQIKESKQFGGGSFQPLLKSPARHGAQVNLLGQKRLFLIKKVNHEGWAVVLLPSTKLISVYRLVGIALTVFLIALVAGFFMVFFLQDKAKRRLAQSDERFRHVSEISKDWIWEMDAQGRFTYSNQSVQEVLGYERKDVLGRFYHDFFMAENMPAAQKDVERLFEEEKQLYRFAQAHVHKEGHIVHLEITGGMLLDEKGRLFGYRGVTRDVSEQVAVEQVLLQAKERAELLYRLIPSAIFTVDNNKIVTSWNNAAEALTGYGKDEILGKSCELFAFKPCESHCGLFDDLLEKPIRNKECIIRRKDGQERVILKNVDVLTDYAGRRVGGIESFEDITDRKRTEQNLQENERKYRELVENANSLIIRMDAEGKILFMNEFAEKFFCYEPDEILGQNVVGTIVPEVDSGGKDLKSSIRQIVEHIDQYQYHENENIRKDGSRAWIAWTNKVVENQAGEKEILSIGTDLTERKRMEESLRKFSFAVEQSPSTIVITDLDGNIEYVNPKFSLLTGYSFDEVKGQNPRVLKSDETKSEEYKELWETILSGKEWRGEFHNKRKDGSLFWEAASIAPIKDSSGRMTHFISIKEDITEQKRVADELRSAFDELQQLEYIVNLGRAIVFRWRAEQGWPVDFVSDSVDQFGYSSSEFTEQGLSFEKIIYPEDLSRVQEEIARAVGQRLERFTQQYRLYCKNGSLRWIEAHMTIRYNIEGRQTFFQGVVFDITSRKEAERKITEAVNMKSDFVSLVSHELRTPLAAIQESINIVYEQQTGEINAEQQEFLGIAKRNVERLGTLINDVLDYQKLEAGRMELKLEEQDINVILKEACETMTMVSRNKGLQLDVELESDLPKVSFDQNMIIQVVNNLINNAIKFTDTGRVTVRSSLEDRFVCVSVSDSGIGIKDEDKHKLFQSFSQIDTGPGRKTGSSGLGLAICKRIIELHGGSIWVDSEFGKGSTFSFVLSNIGKS